jgi:hypothetical protein
VNPLLRGIDPLGGDDVDLKLRDLGADLFEHYPDPRYGERTAEAVITLNHPRDVTSPRRPQQTFSNTL